MYKNQIQKTISIINLVAFFIQHSKQVNHKVVHHNLHSPILDRLMIFPLLQIVIIMDPFIKQPDKQFL